MNSHDQGVNYALMSEEARQATHTRQIQIADVTDAMAHGFKAEPDLSPCHLPLLSDAALARVYNESEDWRGKWRERDLEKQLRDMVEAEHQISGYYVNLREIVGALHVPPTFRPIDGKPQTIAWTEQKARELVAMAEASEKHASAAKDAERRVDLLERYVRACDEKRLPYNWNVFRMPTQGLQTLVNEHEAREKLGRLATLQEDAMIFETRVRQELEQSLRWHSRNADATRQLIEHHNGLGIDCTVADELLDALLDRPQAGEQWTVWTNLYKPGHLMENDVVEIKLYDGRKNTLEAGVIDWEQVEMYRRVK